MEKDDLKTALRKYLLTDCQTDLPALVCTDRKLASDTLKELISEQKEALKAHTDKITAVLTVLYNDSNADLSDPVSVFYRYIADSYLYKDASVCQNDELLCGGLKNKYLFDLIEKIRFAKMQRESLRDTTSYNRHIEKSISDMRNDLTVLFELRCTYEETAAVLEKYLEYNINVNTARNWLKLDGLSKYEPFRKFLMQSKDQILNLYSRGSIRTESLKYFVESKDVQTIEIYMKTLVQTAAEDRAKAEEMISADVCFPFDGVYIGSVVDLFSADAEKSQLLLDQFMTSDKKASLNVLALLKDQCQDDNQYETICSKTEAYLQSVQYQYNSKNWLS